MVSLQYLGCQQRSPHLFADEGILNVLGSLRSSLLCIKKHTKKTDCQKNHQKKTKTRIFVYKRRRCMSSAAPRVPEEIAPSAHRWMRTWHSRFSMLKFALHTKKERKKKVLHGVFAVPRVPAEIAPSVRRWRRTQRWSDLLRTSSQGPTLSAGTGSTASPASPFPETDQVIIIIVPPKTECGCPSGGGIKNGRIRYPSYGGTQKERKDYFLFFLNIFIQGLQT